MEYRLDIVYLNLPTAILIETEELMQLNLGLILSRIHTKSLDNSCCFAIKTRPMIYPFEGN